MKHVAVIGGGIAGMEAASVLASYQHHVTLIEKTSGTGGKLNDWSHLFPDFADPDLLLGQMRNEIRERDVNIIHNTEIRSIRRQNGGFELSDGRYVKLRADAVVVAAGFNPFGPAGKKTPGTETRGA